MRLALGEDIGQINVESAEELDILSALAASLGRTARVALRVNPDVDAGTHAKITTGRAEDKFGIPYADAAALYARAATLPGIQPVGLATHIGSQVLALAPYRAAFARIAELVRTLRQAGHSVSTVDCGGGLGIPYRNEPAASPTGLAAAIRDAFHTLDVQVMLEPGRWLVGSRGRVAGLGGAGEAGRRRPLRGAGRSDERPGAAGHVRRLARHRAALRHRCREAAATGRHRRPGLRIRRHVRPRPLAAAAGAQTLAWRSWTPARMVRS